MSFLDKITPLLSKGGRCAAARDDELEALEKLAACGAGWQSRLG